MYEKELETYQRELPKLLEQHEEKWVLINENEVVEIFASNLDAIREGRRKFGWGPIFVKKIEKIEQPLIYSRRLRFTSLSQELPAKT